MKVKQIVFTKKDTAELINVEINDAINEDEVLVKTAFSTISCGTEKANITGDPTVSIGSTGEAVFPRYLGYSSSGIVVKKGVNVTDVEVGDSVAVFAGYHKSYNLVNKSQIVKLPENADLNSAAMAYIATFPLAAIRKTSLEAGEPALVMGLGILGLIGVSILRACGAVPIIAADPKKERREMALKFGADYALDPLDKDFAHKVKELTGGGAKVAIEVTGVGAGLNGALDCMQKFGRVALLGCTRNSSFEVDYYRKVHGPGISLIGAHTVARPQLESSHGMYTHSDDIAVILKMCAMERLNLKDMISKVYNPKEAPEVYTNLINNSKFPVVVQFDWSTTE